MAYITVDAFNLGVDRRRPIYVSPPGSLWTGVNGHLSRGGDFEKRKAFTTYAALPEGTFGLLAPTAGLLVFGSIAAPIMPAGVTYQQCAHESALAMTDVVDADLFAGKAFVIARYSDNSTRVFYDGTRISFFDDKTATICHTHKDKVYVGSGSLLYFCAPAAPTDWAGINSGFINMSNQFGGSSEITSITTYIGRLAVFGRRTVQLWDMQSDVSGNALLQTLGETGSASNHSVRQLGDIDVFYLADNGIRSLRSREQIDVAGVHDVGTSIDTLVLEWVASLTAAEVANAVSIVDPVEGRFLMGIAGRIFVFSYFPSAKITAWTWYELGLTVDDFAVLLNRIYARSGNTIYLYGGADNATYDLTRVTLQLPYLAIGKHGTAKHLHGIDIASQGAWTVAMLTNPRNDAEVLYFGDMEGVTYGEDHTASIGHFYHLAPLLVHEAAGAASLSNVTIYYEGAESE